MSSIFYSSPTAQLVERQASNRQIVCSSPTRNRILFYARLCTVIVHCVMPRGLAQVIIVLFFICAIFGMCSFQYGLFFLHVFFLVYALFGMCYLWHELFFACVFLEYALFGICSLACALFSMCSLACTLFCMCSFSALAH